MFFHEIAASHGLMTPLCVVWIGDERDGNECKDHNKRACVYGLRFGCVNTTNDELQQGAERLAGAVNSVLRPRHTN